LELSLEKTFQRAILLHQAGNLQEAEQCYHAVLGSMPMHPDANHNLGIIAVQIKKPVAGLPFLKRALESNPNNGQYWHSYIEALIQSGQNNDARHVLQQGIKIGLTGEAVEALVERLANIA